MQGLPPAMIDLLYKTMLAIPAQRFVFSVLHFNHFLCHLLDPSDRTVSAAPPYPQEIRARCSQLVEDMTNLGIEPSPETQALLLLANKDDPKAVLADFEKLSNATRRAMPIWAFNLVLHIRIHDIDEPLTKRKLWEIYTHIGRSGQKPTLLTYELLLEGFGTRCKDEEAVRKLLPKLMASELTWRRETFAAALRANANCGAGDERWFNRLDAQMRKRRIHIDAPILNGIMRYHLNSDKPRAVIRSYLANTKRFEDLMVDGTPDETRKMLVEACAALPRSVKPDDAQGVRMEALETLVSLHDRFRQEDDDRTSASHSTSSSASASCDAALWDLLCVRAYLVLDDHEGAVNLYRTLVDRDATHPRVPSPLMLQTGAQLAASRADATVLETFVREVVERPDVLTVYYDPAVPVDDQEPLEDVLYEPVLVAWLDAGGDPDEVVAKLAELRAVEKRIAGELFPAAVKDEEAIR
ncbi:hypothetical protein HKX48_006216 [Thoreauomyces humboldtii]|nr:hypothetical protein HKX48_006216 [Thoreauomyces humboldtii]